MKHLNGRPLRQGFTLDGELVATNDDGTHFSFRVSVGVSNWTVTLLKTGTRVRVTADNNTITITEGTPNA